MIVMMMMRRMVLVVMMMKKTMTVMMLWSKVQHEKGACHRGAQERRQQCSKGGFVIAIITNIITIAIILIKVVKNTQQLKRNPNMSKKDLNTLNPIWSWDHCCCHFIIFCCKGWEDFRSCTFVTYYIIIITIIFLRRSRRILELASLWNTRSACGTS